MKAEMKHKGRVQGRPYRGAKLACVISGALLPLILSVVLATSSQRVPDGVPVPTDSNVSAYSTKVLTSICGHDGRNVSLQEPLALAMDSKGRLFVAGTMEVYVLDKDYRLKDIIGNTTSATIRTPQMAIPGDVAVDSVGRLYVCDWDTDIGAVHMLSPDLAYLGQVHLPRVPAFPVCIAVDSKDRLIVGEYVTGGESRFLVYSANESDPRHGSMILQKTFQLCPPGGNCTGRHGVPQDITVDSQGRIILAERASQWAPDLNRVVVLDAEFRWLMSFGSRGDSPGSFTGITSAVVDRSGVFVVTDAYRISFFLPNGTYAGRIGGPGSEPGKFNGIFRLLVSGAGRLLIPEHINNRIQEITVDILSLRAISIPEFETLATVVLWMGLVWAIRSRRMARCP